MRLTFIAIAMTIVLTGSAMADTVSVMGRGTSACSLWITNTDSTDEQWVMGYLSGYAVASGSDILKGTTKEAIVAAVKQKCTLKSGEKVFNILRSVIRDLE